jgi:ribonuclease H / adenosylcobalamin/alpha-ribazole phosphatase
VTAADSPRRVVVEADGGSRGNPGQAAYGALLRDADTGDVIAESAARIGIASNNVAEYSALIAGLELAAEHAPGASLEVRMDSKLVIEQMAGRWKVKHPDMRPLALRARPLAPPDTVWTWVPREQNLLADALVNAVLDQQRPDGVSFPDALREPSDVPAGVAQSQDPAAAAAAAPDSAPQPVPHDPLVGWRSSEQGQPTTLVLLRHGVTASTEARLFCGSGGTDPGLTAAGRAQAERAGEWLVRRQPVTHVVASPLRRTRETAAVAADRLGLEVELEEDLAELEFGEWDGLTVEQVRARWPDELARWLADEHEPPPGGESLAALDVRVRRGLDRVLTAHPGDSVLVVSHVNPIKAVVRRALDAPAPVMHRMQLAPASLTVVKWWPDGVTAMQTFSHVPD